MIEWIVSSNILILVVAGLRFFLRSKLRLKLRYALWALVLVRLLVPIQFGSSAISIQNPLEKAPVVQQLELAEKVEHFVYHADGTATGYYQWEPPLEHTEDSGKATPVDRAFTTQQALTLTRLRDILKLTKTWLLGVWIAGMAVTGAVFLLSNLRFARRLRRSRRLLQNAGLPVYVTEMVDTPCLFGLFRPAIYLTPAAAEEPRHREYAIAHEKTHHRHRDGIWSALRCMCLVLHWYNPLVWWAAALSRADGELACDEETITCIGEENRAEYGRVLIDLTCRKRVDLFRAATMMTGSGKNLKERITLIAKQPKMAAYTLIAVVLVAAVAVGCTFTGGKEPTASGEITDSTSSTEDTELSQSADVHIFPGEPLEEEELEDFEKLFAPSTGVDDPRYYNLILCCGYYPSGGFTKPEDINLRILFNTGFWENGNYLSFTEEEQAFVESENMTQETDIIKRPISRMDQVLRRYLGISFAQSSKAGLLYDKYFQDTECYFGYSSGAVGTTQFTMLHGSRETNGRVHLICLVDEYAKTTVKLTLWPASEGAEQPYHVRACYEVEPCR